MLLSSIMEVVKTDARSGIGQLTITRQTLDSRFCGNDDFNSAFRNLSFYPHLRPVLQSLGFRGRDDELVRTESFRYLGEAPVGLTDFHRAQPYHGPGSGFDQAPFGDIDLLFPFPFDDRL